jgi:hypothetical protein
MSLDRRQRNTDLALIVTTTTTTSYTALLPTLASTTASSAPTGAVDGRSSFSSTLVSVVGSAPSVAPQQASSTSSAGGPPPGTVGNDGTGWRVALGAGLGLGILALFLIGLTAVWLARWHWSGRREHDQAATRAPPKLALVGGSSEVILTGAGVFPDLDDEKGEKGGWKSFALFRKKSSEKDFLRPDVEPMPSPLAAFRPDNRLRMHTPEPATHSNATRLGGIDPTLTPIVESASTTRLDPMASAESRGPPNGRSTPLLQTARTTHAKDGGVTATAVQTPPGLHPQYSEGGTAAVSTPREWPLSMEPADQMSPASHATDSSEARLFRRFDAAVANAPPAFHGPAPRSHPRGHQPPPLQHPEAPYHQRDDSRSRSASPSNLSVPARPSTSPAYPIYAEIQRLQQQRWLVDEREQIGAEYDRLMRARNQERLRVLRWAQGGPANHPGHQLPQQQQGQHLHGPGSVGAARKAAAAMSGRMSESSDR